MRLFILVLAVALAQGRVLLDSSNTTQPWAQIPLEDLGSNPTLAAAQPRFTFRMETISADNRTCAEFRDSSGPSAYRQGLTAVMDEAAKSLGLEGLEVLNATVTCRDPPKREGRKVYRKRIRAEAITSPIAMDESVRLLNEVGVLGIDGGLYEEAVDNAGGSSWPMAFFLYKFNDAYSLCIREIEETYCNPKKAWNPAATAVYEPES